MHTGLIYFPFEFPYPVHRKFMVGFSIQFNRKTNHKLPVNGIRKIRTERNKYFEPKTSIYDLVPVNRSSAGFQDFQNTGNDIGVKV